MNVQVIDVKTGKLKVMPEKYARILVRMKRARWPEQEPLVEVPESPAMEKTIVVDPEAQPEPSKKRGRKPKTQDQE